MSNGSTTNEYQTIAELFGRLDRWRHLPAYQLERRADIFFALFLPEVLNAHLCVKNCTLIPEFPIKKESSNESNKVDYLAVSEDRKRAFLIELKTDMESISGGQIEYLHEAARAGLRELVGGVLKICKASKKRKKYAHLLRLLSDVVPIEYENDLFSAERAGYVQALDRIETEVERTRTEDWPCLEVVYIQPVQQQNVINFEEFAETIEKGDGIRSLFANHLKKWAAHKAGSPNPKDWHPS